CWAAAPPCSFSWVSSQCVSELSEPPNVERGPLAQSLRAIAAEIGVSHTATRHHVGSNAGLLPAIAPEEFGILRSRRAVPLRMPPPR
ncbi:MAG: TetR/AcrR family transcriptional regulator, partial [Microbacterium gubbeenense]